MDNYDLERKLNSLKYDLEDKISNLSFGLFLSTGINVAFAFFILVAISQI